MLKLALVFELRALRRSPAGTGALIAFMAVGILALVVGQRFVSQWEEALAAAEKAQASSIEEGRGFLARGEAGPSERPWVDLAQPLWQDWYASTRVAREPGGLAAIAAGASDPAPAVFRVNRFADPLAAGGYRIENPELAAGGIDLVFVLALLTPLLVGVLGLEIGGRERETHIDRLVVVHSGSSRPWLVARMLAVTAIAGAAALVLCLVAGVTGAADPLEMALLTIFALAYAALWGGLLLTVNARASTVRGAAFSFGALWTVLCVLLPTLAAEVALGRVQADFALAETLEARALRFDAYEQEIETVLPELYERFPQLRQLPAAAEDPLDPLVSRHAYDAIVAATIDGRHAELIREDGDAQRVTRVAAWLSPTVALGLGLERLAGVGPEAATAFRQHLVDAMRGRVRWVVEKAWAKSALSAADFDALVASAPPPFRPRATRLVEPVLILALWALVAWMVALAGLARTERRLLET